jgi:hypothetical protein
MKPPASKNKRKPNDGYDPLTFKQEDARKMTAKEQGEDLLRILIAGLQRKLNLPQTTTHPQTARPRKKGPDQVVQPPHPLSPDRPQEIYSVEKRAFIFLPARPAEKKLKC